MNASALFLVFCSSVMMGLKLQAASASNIIPNTTAEILHNAFTGATDLQNAIEISEGMKVAEPDTVATALAKKIANCMDNVHQNASGSIIEVINGKQCPFNQTNSFTNATSTQPAIDHASFTVTGANTRQQLNISSGYEQQTNRVSTPTPTSYRLNARYRVQLVTIQNQKIIFKAQAISHGVSNDGGSTYFVKHMGVSLTIKFNNKIYQGTAIFDNPNGSAAPDETCTLNQTSIDCREFNYIFGNSLVNPSNF